MTVGPLTLPDAFRGAEAINSLRTHGVRRTPVLASNNQLTGNPSIDGLQPAVARELNGLAAPRATPARHKLGPGAC